MKHLFLLCAGALMLMGASCSGKAASEAASDNSETTAQAVKVAPTFESGVVNELTDASILEPGTPVNKLTVVDFNAIWCGPCRQLTPVLHEMATKYGDKVDFVSVDVDQFGNLMDQYKLGNSIPAVLILEPNGKSVSYIGTGDLLPQEKFEAIIDNLLN
ncbi:MAG: thioredoxin family protein [Bacteroidales bacterium]|nr:thioredoxin family protein [Bacteroidales bacterium]